MLDDILDLQEAVEYTGISPKTLRSYITQGKVRATKKGNAYVFLKSDLRELMSPAKLEAKAESTTNVDENFLEKTVPVSLRQLLEWGKLALPGSEVHKDRPFLSKSKTMMTS